MITGPLSPKITFVFSCIIKYINFKKSNMRNINQYVEYEHILVLMEVIKLKSSIT